jgi:hypothetical protein
MCYCVPRLLIYSELEEQRVYREGRHASMGSSPHADSSCFQHPVQRVGFDHLERVHTDKIHVGFEKGEE